MNAHAPQPLRYVGDCPHILAAFAEIDRRAAERNKIVAERAFHERRGRLRQARDMFAASPFGLMEWLSAPLIGSLVARDMGEALMRLRREVRRQDHLLHSQHLFWAYNGTRHRQAHERLLIARYFSRFGARLWQRSAA